MKKGFTLVELLAVIAILGIISLIVVPAVDRSLNSGKEDLYQTQIKQIEKGVKDYYTEHLNELPKTTNASSCKTIKSLQDDGYLPLNIENPKTGELFASSTRGCVQRVTENSFKYYVEVS